MTKTNSIIQINGRHYDAATGLPLVSADTQPNAKPTNSKKRAAENTTAKTVKAKPRPARRSSAKPSAAHKPEPAHTLMRQAVKKPLPGLKRRVKAQGDVDSLVGLTGATVVVNPSVDRIDPKRLNRAKQVAQSQAISHFSAAVFDGRLATLASSVADSTLVAAHQPVGAAKAVSGKPRTTAELLERAVQTATSHQQPAVKPARRHRRRQAGLVTAAALAILALAAFGGRGLTDVRLHAASAKAGFAASLPGYEPAGYSLGQLTYSSGEVAANFHSNSSTASYSLTQKRTTWDSQTLVNSFVAPTDHNYQTISSGDLRIYLYDQHNATWLSDGLWYILQGNDSLSRQQLIQLATSF